MNRRRTHGILHGQWADGNATVRLSCPERSAAQTRAPGFAMDKRPRVGQTQTGKH